MRKWMKGRWYDPICSRKCMKAKGLVMSDKSRAGEVTKRCTKDILCWESR